MSTLSEPARQALLAARAKRLSYAVRLLRAPDGRSVAILGEAHLKLGRAARLGRAVVGAFELRGVESFQARRVAWGRLLMLLVEAPRVALRVLSLGLVRDSTIVDARRLPGGTTFELESTSRAPLALHVGSVHLALFFASLLLAMIASWLPRSAGPSREVATSFALLLQLHLLALPLALALRRHRWAWLVHPFVAILVVRDEHMAEGAVRMLALHRDAPAAVLVMGRAHGPGVEALLVRRYGFQRDEL